MAKRAGRPSWFKFFLSIKPLLDAVPDESAGKAIKAALAYFEDRTHEVSSLDPLALALFTSLKPYIDDSYADFARRVENGRTGGRPPKPTETNGNHYLPLQTEEEVEEDEEAEDRSYSFNHSVSQRNNFSGFSTDFSTDLSTSQSTEPSPELYTAEETKRRVLNGTLGRGVVLLSDAQMDDLLDKLSIEEFDRYVEIVADMELSGRRYTKKTHYQAILDMAYKDRRVR